MSELMKFKSIGKDKIKITINPKIADRVKFIFGIKDKGKLKTVTCKIIDKEIEKN